MNKIEFNRTNGNVPKTLAGEDHISGLIAYVGNLPVGFADAPIHAVSTIDRAEGLGITSDSADWDIRVLHYQLSEIFRVHPAISLYIGLFTKPTGGTYTFSEVKVLQNFVGGKLRQVGVYLGDVALTADHVVALEGVCDGLEAADIPLSAILAPKVTNIDDLPMNLAASGRSRVSVIIGQAGSGVGVELYESADNVGKASVSGLGVVLGLLSRSKVHQSIGWVGEFPTGVELPAFGDGTLYRDLDKAIVEALDSARYLFFVTYSGVASSYLNDSHNLDAAISDYAMIENVRTMDKAVRGVRAYLLPELGGSLYVEAETGKLQAYTVKHLETTANKALEEMEKAGELSGCKVEIDPEQNVLSTSTVEFVIKQVGVGVMRRIKVKIGFAESV